MPEAKQKLGYYKTAPEDRISKFQKFIYGIGALANDSQAAFIGGMVIVLNLGLGVNPFLVGIAGCIPRIFDAILDPIIGYSSDNARTRYGRRKPFIFWGAIAAGLCYALMFQLHKGQSEMYYFWYFLIFQALFFVGFTCYSIPWIALGYELTPDYHERTRLQSTSRIFGQIPWLLAPWCWAMMHNKKWFPNPETGGHDIVLGGRTLALIIGAIIIFGGILPSLFNKERFDKLPKPVKKANYWAVMKNMFKGIATTFKNKHFVKLCAVTFLIFNGFMLSATFIAYVIFFYVFATQPSLDMAYSNGGTLLGWYGTFSAICTIGVVAIIPRLSRKFGKRNTFFITIPLSIIGFALKWIGYNQTNPYLLLICAPLITFGLGSLFTICLSMVADVCDEDELATGQRREGMFSAVYWWMVKLGLALASLIGGALLNGTGFKQELGLGQAPQTLLWMRIFDVTIPIVTSIIAIFIIRTIDVSEEQAHQVRLKLEERRGKV